MNSKELVDWMTINKMKAFQEVLVDVNETGVFCIGDVHGCYSELVELIEKIRDFCQDKQVSPLIYVLGDLIDRGPEFEKLFDLIADNDDVRCLMGNHEWNFLLEAQGIKECRSRARQKNHEVLQTLPEEKQEKILDTIGNMSTMVNLYMTSQDHGNIVALLTHAPIKDLETRSNTPIIVDNMLFRGTPLDEDAIQARYGTYALSFIHGHQSWGYSENALYNASEAAEKGICSVINVDSSCVYGEKLTAYSPTHHEVIQVNAQKVYCKPH